jgi:uncharacterized membrane protein
MTSLHVRRYGSPGHAEIALRELDRLQHRRRIAIDDSAVVSWEVGAPRPRAYQAGTVDGTGLSGAFWGLLFSLAFLLPPDGTRVDRVGLSDAFLRALRDRIVPGTSALFVLTSGDPPELPAGGAELIVHALTPDEGTALHRHFAADLEPR